MGFFKKTVDISIVKQIEDFFKQMNYNYQLIEESDSKSIIQTGLALTIGNTNGFLVIHHQLSLVEVLTFAPVHVPENKRMEVSKLFDLADFSTYIGNIHVNHDTGEIRCKTYFKYSDKPLDFDIIKDNFFESFHVLERFVPAAMQIVYGRVNAETAFSEVIGRVNPMDN